MAKIMKKVLVLNMIVLVFLFFFFFLVLKFEISFGLCDINVQIFVGGKDHHDFTTKKGKGG